MAAHTAKNWNISKAPKRITLLGDKTKKPEPAQHIIEFPGGAVEVSRTSDGHYWAHIHINRKQAIDDCEGFNASIGEVIDSRVGREFPYQLEELPTQRAIEQVAVLIKVKR